MEKKGKRIKPADRKHAEKMEILQKAKEAKGRQLVISTQDGNLEEIDELKRLIAKQVDDPEEKHSLYYQGIRNVLMKYLPKDRDIRKIIYDEKNVFLNRGKKLDKTGRRGSDGRMTYNEDMSQMVELISNWIISSQDPVELYTSIYDLNETMGFGHQDYDETSDSFRIAMSKRDK